MTSVVDCRLNNARQSTRSAHIRSEEISDGVVLAPPERFVSYMAIFHRLFVEAQDAYIAGDPVRMATVGLAAYRLHNVPGNLLHHSHEGYNAAENMDDRTRQFVDDMAKRGVSAAMVTRCQALMSFEGAAEELGITPEQASTIAAPTAALKHYLNLIYWSFLEMRVIGCPKSFTPQGWADLPEHWSKQNRDSGKLNALFGALLLNVPRELVTSSDFAPNKLKHNAIRLAKQIPKRHWERWATVFRLRGLLALAHFVQIPAFIRGKSAEALEKIRWRFKPM